MKRPARPRAGECHLSRRIFVILLDKGRAQTMTGFESPNCIGNELGGFLKQFSDFVTTKGVSTESGEGRNLPS
jgi:hypothetical protein